MALINVTVGGVTKYLENNVPYVEGGEPAIMDSDHLEKRVGGHDNENETVEFVEYWEGDQLRHRSVNMVLKTSLSTLIDQASFG